MLFEHVGDRHRMIGREECRSDLTLVASLAGLQGTYLKERTAERPFTLKRNADQMGMRSTTRRWAATEEPGSIKWVRSGVLQAFFGGVDFPRFRAVVRFFASFPV
jgi:hypothetical protein